MLKPLFDRFDVLFLLFTTFSRSIVVVCVIDGASWSRSSIICWSTKTDLERDNRSASDQSGLLLLAITIGTWRGVWRKRNTIGRRYKIGSGSDLKTLWMVSKSSFFPKYYWTKWFMVKIKKTMNEFEKFKRKSMAQAYSDQDRPRISRTSESDQINSGKFSVKPNKIRDRVG